MKTYLDQTKGERMVRADFNPSKEGNVAHIKRMHAAMIDSLEEMTGELCEKVNSSSISDEEKMLRTQEIEAAMYDAQHYLSSASTRAVFAATAIL